MRKLEAIHFISPVGDPANPDGVYRRSFAAPYVLEALENGAIRVSAGSASMLVSGIGFFATEAPAASPAAVEAVEPSKPTPKTPGASKAPKERGRG